jgi:hypothetical protein
VRRQLLLTAGRLASRTARFDTRLRYRGRIARRKTIGKFTIEFAIELPLLIRGRAFPLWTLVSPWLLVSLGLCFCGHGSLLRGGGATKERTRLATVPSADPGTWSFGQDAHAGFAVPFKTGSARGASAFKASSYLFNCGKSRAVESALAAAPSSAI